MKLLVESMMLLSGFTQKVMEKLLCVRKVWRGRSKSLLRASAGEVAGLRKTINADPYSGSVNSADVRDAAVAKDLIGDIEPVTGSQISGSLFPTLKKQET